jgi:N-methylhydantoinase A
VGDHLSLGAEAAAFGICEVVDENMANAARVHAVENGKNIADNVMIAFGGAAPLHAARLCEKLGIDRCLIPPGAGVGSAIGFLRAPFGYEALMSKVTRLSRFDIASVNAMLADLKATAERFVRTGSTGSVTCDITAFMRYVGQGWEIPVPLPDRPFTAGRRDRPARRLPRPYARFFGRAIDGLDGLEIEVVTWSVKVQDERPPPPPSPDDRPQHGPTGTDTPGLRPKRGAGPSILPSMTVPHCPQAPASPGLPSSSNGKPPPSSPPPLMR